MTALAPELLDELAARAGRPDFPKLEAQLRSSGYCARPVRLVGHIEACTGDGRRRVWSTRTEPDGILRKACGNRREAVCPPCAERYRQDAYHLISAGLRGGKGVPDTVAEHPAIFVTLTAPSFGLVHTRALDPAGEPRRCRPRRDAKVCRHGVRLSCAAVHAEDDPCLGEPLCTECFDHEGAVIWNNLLGELWRRTTIYLPRKLARRLGITQKQLRKRVRAAYVKVAEYQRRGLVHLHVVIRLDRKLPAYRARRGQAARPMLHRRAARARAPRCGRRRARAATGRARRRHVTWGTELDVRRARRATTRREVAGYLAKYATKSTEQAGSVCHPRHRGRGRSLARARARARLPACRVRAPRRTRARRPPVRGVRARARLPRPLPDQEPPLLDHLHRPAPGARAARARAAPGPDQGPRAASERRRGRARGELPVRRPGAYHSRRRVSWPPRRPPGHGRSARRRARSGCGPVSGVDGQTGGVR